MCALPGARVCGEAEGDGQQAARGVLYHRMALGMCR